MKKKNEDRIKYPLVKHSSQKPRYVQFNCIESVDMLKTKFSFYCGLMLIADALNMINALK